MKDQQRGWCANKKTFKRACNPHVRISLHCTLVLHVLRDCRRGLMICHLDVVFCSLRASQNFQNENDITWLLNTLLYTEYDTEYFTVQTTGSTVSQYTKIQQLIFLLFLFPNHKNRTQPQLLITTHHRQRLNNYSNNNNYNYTRWQKQSHHISSISTSLLLEPDTTSSVGGVVR